MYPKFEDFGKIARFSREIVISEKIDGTNAQIYIHQKYDGAGYPDARLSIIAGSRNRWITPEDDNYGFARWVKENQKELLKLGEGRHYGEWWGSGIQRGYGLTKGDKRFSLFNTHRWNDPEIRPVCCSVVPELYRGPMNAGAIADTLKQLEHMGSSVSPGFMNPEGIVIYHSAAKTYFKKTLDKDEEPKGKNK